MKRYQYRNRSVVEAMQNTMGVDIKVPRQSTVNNEDYGEKMVLKEHWLVVEEDGRRTTMDNNKTFQDMYMTGVERRVT